MTGSERDPYLSVKHQAVEQASRCRSFRPDVEEEWVSDEPVSCLNCYFRRWTRDSFHCMAGKPETTD
ncbi:hypothetical protein SAMN04487895_110200 [Paenibacillus sophorae]|uniref:Uncharacterized protein n=1 Tax=Paenibacillus sophorae TaxID=1333845 RepID=A0A1H8S0V9_9BACL|nr:hypothetical protein [Paenibacillus sophorae]SEO72176.1 hypothetical protein SAMN04487895_110200 [Paenibacillus sophorae]